MNSQLNDRLKKKKRWIEVFYSPLRARTTIIRRTGRKMRRKRRRRRNEKKKKRRKDFGNSLEVEGLNAWRGGGSSFRLFKL